MRGRVDGQKPLALGYRAPFFAGFLRLNLHETFRLKWTSRLSARQHVNGFADILGISWLPLMIFR